MPNVILAYPDAVACGDLAEQAQRGIIFPKDQARLVHILSTIYEACLRGAAITVPPWEPAQQRVPSFEEVAKALVRVRNRINEQAAKGIVKIVGRADTLRGIKRERYIEVFDCCNAVSPPGGEKTAAVDLDSRSYEARFQELYRVVSENMKAITKNTKAITEIYSRI